MFFHQLAQALLQGLELGAQQVGLELAEEVLQRDQRQDLLLVKSQAGHFAVGMTLLQHIAAPVTIEADGHMQLVAQLGQVPLEGGG